MASPNPGTATTEFFNLYIRLLARVRALTAAQIMSSVVLEPSSNS
jgi:hypothetical protein